MVTGLRFGLVLTFLFCNPLFIRNEAPRSQFPSRLFFLFFCCNWNGLMYKGNKGDRHAGLHYQCVIEVSGNINANANIKLFQIK